MKIAFDSLLFVLLVAYTRLSHFHAHANLHPGEPVIYDMNGEDLLEFTVTQIDSPLLADSSPTLKREIVDSFVALRDVGIIRVKGEPDKAGNPLSVGLLPPAENLHLTTNITLDDTLNAVLNRVPAGDVKDGLRLSGIMEGLPKDVSEINVWRMLKVLSMLGFIKEHGERSDFFALSSSIFHSRKA